MLKLKEMYEQLFGGTKRPQRSWREGEDLMVNLEPERPPGGLPGENLLVVNMGPQHPSTHGVLRLQLITDGEIIVRVIPHIGYMHRCFEKHAENLPYDEIIPYTDRLDYLASMNQNLAYVLGVERLMKIEVPERVEYIRVIMAELNRIASHLLGLGTYALDVGSITPFLWLFRDREKILDLFEWVSGARLLYNYIWIGGLARDLPQGFLDKVREFLNYFEPNLDELDAVLSYNKIFIERTAKVGILRPETAISYGVTGPNLRGSGVKWDLRRDEPYSIYDRFEFDIPVGTDEYGPVGSCWNRYMVRAWEMKESIRILRQALNQIPAEGDVKKAIPKRLAPPAGEIYMRTETPRGELGFYIVSHGTNQPYRVKVRSPSFCAISALNEMAVGAMIADAVATVGSLDIVLCEIDR